MHMKTATLSQAGGRQYNEDACGHERLADQAECWVLADGLGGHGGGEVAARLAVEQILAAFRAHPVVVPETLHSCLEAAQTTILAGQEKDPKLASMRTTAVVLLSDFRLALWAHLGDSRLYHFRSGQAVTWTRDHSVPQALADAGDIPPDSIRYHEDRNRLLRSLGSPEKFRPTIPDQPLVLKAGDAFLLCSDGFWEHVLETEMEVDLAKALEPQTWLKHMEVRLRRRAPPGHDNYSAVAVFVSP